MPPPDDEVVPGGGYSEQDSSKPGGKPVRYFTSEELRQLNRPENAHVAIRGKVKAQMLILVCTVIADNVCEGV